MSVSILILAAGKGTRMKSALPKVLHPVAGVPMIERVVRVAGVLKPSAVCVIVGHGGDQVKAHVAVIAPKTGFVVQKSLNGSGGAVKQALAWLKKQIFGKKSERIVPDLAAQPLLPEMAVPSPVPEPEKETIRYERSKVRKNKGIDTLSFPDDLPVKRVEDRKSVV